MGEASWAHDLLEVAWPQPSLDQKVWRTGVDQSPRPLLPCSLVGCCLRVEALVRRPGQAKAEKPGGMEQRGPEPPSKPRDAGTRVGDWWWGRGLAQDA